MQLESATSSAGRIVKVGQYATLRTDVGPVRVRVEALHADSEGISATVSTPTGPREIKLPRN